ncbi:MAG: DUF418 domain-containing protein [Anaerolineae bacterium]|nr:DUF418 domain-containing protein [Anaerolineae bacterium]
MSAPAPKPLTHRLLALDVLRGFALLGIFVVNMVDFSSSGFRLGTLGVRGDTLDQIVDLAIAFFFVTKFYLLFSFLFGVGFAVQMRSAEAKGQPFVGVYLRRLAVLLLIGLAHAILIWDGDILRLYAVAGVLLLLVRPFSDRMLMTLAVVIAVGGLAFFGLVPSTQGGLFRTESVQTIVYGNYADLVAMRLGNIYVPDIQTPMVLAMFLTGMVIGRAGVLDDPARYRPFLRRAWKWALPVGLVGNGLLIVGFAEEDLWMTSIGVHIGAPALSFVYVCAVLLNADRLGWLAPIGQMALTTYLSHSLIGTTLFYGYGLGLYDQLAPTVTFALTFAIFALQVVISIGWMRAFRFGPVEWVWRSLSYGKLQPLLRRA